MNWIDVGCCCWWFHFMMQRRRSRKKIPHAQMFILHSNCPFFILHHKFFSKCFERSSEMMCAIVSIDDEKYCSYWVILSMTHDYARFQYFLLKPTKLNRWSAIFCDWSFEKGKKITWLQNSEDSRIEFHYRRVYLKICC